MNRWRILANFIVIFVFIGIIIYVGLAIKNTFNPTVKINLNQAAVVKEMQSINRLETASFTMEKVIDAGTSGNALQQFLVGDKILLIAHGQVIAGFDLSKLTKNDIYITDKNITLQLPAPQILVTSLDNTQTRVYDRRHGILNPGDKDLESKVRQAAQESIRAAACQENILSVASDNGRKQLTGLLKALGFEQVTIVVPSASC